MTCCIYITYRLSKCSYNNKAMVLVALANIYSFLSAKALTITIFHIDTLFNRSSRPPEKSAYWKIIFFILSSKTYVVGSQKKRLNG